MTLVVFLRGVNVGGHRTFRPSALARALKEYDVVNVGAAGTFVVRKPGSRASFLNALRRRLPFETQIVLCDAREVALLAQDDPFAGEGTGQECVRFVGILTKRIAEAPRLPMSFPSERECLVRIIGWKGQFVFGFYRRHMKTIGYLGRIDKLLGTVVTIRSWSTMASILKVLESKTSAV